MPFEATSRIQVMNHYGPRQTGGTVGVERTADSRNVVSFELTGQSLVDGFLPPFVLPKGAKITAAYVTVDEAFTGVTSVVLGEGNDEATNGITLTAANLALGTRDVTSSLAGEWAATAAAATTKAARVGIVVNGTPDPLVGRASVTIDYIYKRRDDTEWPVDEGTVPTYPPQL